MKKNVILISGKQGSGKTTLAKALVEMLDVGLEQRAFHLRFADPIYEMHNAILDMADKRFGLVPPPGGKDGRLLQLLGTEWGREVYGPTVWTNCMHNRISKLELLKGEGVDQVYVIDDCRFQSEIDAFPHALKIRLEADRDTRKERAEGWRATEHHGSETALDGRPELFDLVIDTTLNKATPTARMARAYWFAYRRKMRQ